MIITTTTTAGACEECWRVHGTIVPAVRWIDDGTGEASCGLCEACAWGWEEAETEKAGEYGFGWHAAERTILVERWTPQRAREYLAQCAEAGAAVAEGRDDRDRGFMDRVRMLAEASP